MSFAGVHLRYPGAERETLSGVDLAVAPGHDRRGRRAPPGSGKTSLVNLVPRFYDATEGAVLVDGIDVRDVTLPSLRGQIGFVMQDSVLFSGSVRENIAYGRPDATDAEIEAAARAAQAHEFILELPEATTRASASAASSSRAGSASASRSPARCSSTRASW